ncbi:MAG: DUF2868 domain-containing protein [Verrucomicrobiota bacterium]
MGRDRTGWRLGDLVDFEVLLASEGAERGARRIYREEIGPELGEGLSEGERRRRGLRLWLEEKRGDELMAGRKLERGLGIAGSVVALVMLFVGMGLVRGLLQTIPEPYEGRGYNLWLFLGATLGVQWLLMILGLIGWLAWRRRGKLSLPQELIGFLGRKFGGVRAREAWEQLMKMQGRGYGSVLGWRLGRIAQQGGQWFNFGMVLGLIGCLWFLKVRFYWESTLAELSGPRLLELTKVLALPWAWAGPHGVPGAEGVSGTELGGMEMNLEWAARGWFEFLVMAILVWGLLPRILAYFGCRIGERKALSGLDFQEARHRSLWREMVKVERRVVETGQEDGVVLLDVGGSGLEIGAVRPFLLQRLRVNPESMHQLGVLDAEKEKAAEEAMKQSALGVVLVVEGWSLSKPEMEAVYEKVRKTIGREKSLRILVTGTIRKDEVEEANEEEMAEWVKWVDALRDPALEVVRFER